MKTFLKKLIVYLGSVSIIFFLIPFIIIFYGREYVSLRDVVAAQVAYPETIFGFSYVETFFVPYKELLVAQQKPTVLALGTSRVMQVRKEFFEEPSAFINAGGAARSISDAELFIDELPADNHVKLLILGLDQEVLYGEYKQHLPRQEVSRLMRMRDVFALMSRRIYLDYFLKKYTLSEIIHASRSAHAIGISALLNGDGFRLDGSYLYHEAQTNPDLASWVESQIAGKVSTIGQEHQDFSGYYDARLTENLDDLAHLLDVCKQKGITVIGFAPPYPYPVYAAMLNARGVSHDMVAVGPKKAAEIFSAHDDSFFDFSSPESVSGKETEFVDSIHGTDVMYLRMMIYMAERSSALASYVDVASLRRMLAAAQGPFLPF